MYRYRNYIILLILFVSKTTEIGAQIFGGNRYNTQWQQIKTDSIRIIFPQNLTSYAKEISKASHWILENEQSLGKRHRSISIILQNQTTISNGYVGIAPRRSEFFMMPELSNIELTSTPWHLQLAIHEMRHVSQFNNFHKGISKPFGLLFGEQGSAVAMNAVIPNWFWEGDAVHQETYMTFQGRGRLPFFYNGFRSLWLADKRYSLQKIRNGSLKDYVPDHYQLGYLLVNYGSNNFGKDVWKRITTDALRMSSPVYPFQAAIKKHTRLKYGEFISNAFNSYKSDLTQGLHDSDRHFLITKPQKRNVVEYEYPYFMEDGCVIALQSGYRQIPNWVKIDSQGTITSLRVKDISQQNYFTYRNGKVAYTAYQIHPRWGWENYSVIKLWDITTDTIQQITSKTRLFQPDLSPDNSSIAAVHNGTDMQSALCLINVYTQETQYLPNPHSFIFTFPRFNNKGDSIIAAVRNQQGDMGIIRYSLQNNVYDTLLPFGNHPIAYLSVNGSEIYFTCPIGSQDAVFRLDTEKKKIHKVLTMPNGVYQMQINPKSNQILWVTQNAWGKHIGKSLFNDSALEVISNIPVLTNLFRSTDRDNNYFLSALDTPERKDRITRYRKGLHLFYPHSWRASIYEPDYGITIFSNDVMNTLQGELNYNFNSNESSHTAGMNLIYGGFYPQLYTGLSNTWNRSFILNEDSTVRWNENSLKFGILLPLTFVPGRTIHRISINTSYQRDDLQYSGWAAKLFANEKIAFQSTEINWMHQSQQARQHIFPKWVQSVRIQYRSMVAGESGSQLLLNGGLYFPGFMRNHHIVLFGSVQRRDTLAGRLFSNNFPFARRYNALNLPRMRRWSANYHFPIAYPDIGIAHVLYFLRIRANMFYDFTEVRSLRTGRIFPLRSTGSELFFDTRFWNQIPVSFGIRYTRLLDFDLINPNLNPNQFEFIVPMNIF